MIATEIPNTKGHRSEIKGCGGGGDSTFCGSAGDAGGEGGGGEGGGLRQREEGTARLSSTSHN